MLIVWFMVDALAAVARAAVWFMDRTTRNAEKLHSYNFERDETDDQDDRNDDEHGRRLWVQL